MRKTRAGGIGIAIFFVSYFVVYVNAQLPPTATARREDVKYIKCDVCQYLATNAYEQAKKPAKDSTKKPSEEEIIDRMEKVTTAWRTEGEWIATLHLEKSLTGKLAVKNMGRVGECTEACKTIERAAQDVMGEHDTDVAEALFMKRHKNRKEFAQWLCNDLSKACSGSVPSLPSGHVAYPPFKANDPTAQNLDRVMGEMADAGLKGKMYSRDEMLQKYMAEMGVDADGHDAGEL